MRKTTKQLIRTIEELTRRIEVLEFNEKAKGEKYIVSISGRNCDTVYASFICGGRVVTVTKGFLYNNVSARVVGDYIEVYHDTRYCPDGHLHAVLTQNGDQLVKVDVDLYKKAKLYDETTSNAEDKEKADESRSVPKQCVNPV
jgi:hypothetical protein